MLGKNTVTIKVNVSRKEYELYNAFVYQHNKKGIRHDYFCNFEKISLSKLGVASLRNFMRYLLEDEKKYSKY